MTSARHDRLGDLFLRASELDGEPRRRLLESECEDDPELRREIESMLRAESESSDTLAKSAAEIDVAALAGTGGAVGRIGGYDVLRRIGEGGMGVVYEARQEKPRRTVALKVLRRVEDPQSLRRFEYEAEVLGGLRHPAIAHVYEAGVARAGAGEQPYIAMELVEGEPIDAFVRSRSLDVDARLELLVRVADGVAHAHRRGVVHRDLKPANVLVQPDGLPKILDFGIARIASTDGEERTLLTREGDVVGTLGYMSPEQVRADPREVDTRSDVYSLGVVAYELLAGRRPIDTGGVPLPAAMKRVLETEPPRLHGVAHDVPEDVSTIVHKALEKEPDRRYATVEAFAEDVRRFLRREPILARPASTAYRVRRFVQRHRGATIGLSAAVLALVAGTVTSTTLFLREQAALAFERETSSALRETRENLEVALAESRERLALLRDTNEQFENLLRAPTLAGSGADVRMLDVLRRAARETAETFADAPQQRFWLGTTLAASLSGIGMDAEALEQVERARAALAELDEPDPLAEAHLCAIAADALTQVRRPDEASDAIESGLRVLAGLDGREAARRRAELHHVRANLRFDEEDPEGTLAALDEMDAALPPGEDVALLDRAVVLKLRVEALWSLGELEEAENRATAGLLELDRLGLDDSLEAHLLRNVLGAILYSSGRASEAVPIMRTAYEGTRDIAGDAHELVAKQAGNLATLLRQEGRLEESLEFYSEALEVSRRAFDERHPTIAQTLSMRGSLLLQLERWDEGEDDLYEALEILDGQTGPDTIFARASAQSYLAPALRRRGELAEAEQLLRSSLEMKQDVVGTSRHPFLLYELRELSNCAKAREDYAGMFDEGRRALEITLRFEGPGSPASRGLVDRLDDALRLMTEQDGTVTPRVEERRDWMDGALGR